MVIFAAWGQIICCQLTCRTRTASSLFGTRGPVRFLICLDAKLSWIYAGHKKMETFWIETQLVVDPLTGNKWPKTLLWVLTLIKHSISRKDWNAIKSKRTKKTTSREVWSVVSLAVDCSHSQGLNIIIIKRILYIKPENSGRWLQATTIVIPKETQTGVKAERTERHHETASVPLAALPSWQILYLVPQQH